MGFLYFGVSYLIMIHLFIDSNRYLILCGFPENELEGIKKLIKFIKEKRVKLWLPEQVKNEFLRNIEDIPLQKCKILEKIIQSNNSPKLPQIVEFEAELKEIKKLFENKKKVDEEINSKIKSIIELIKSKLKERSIKAYKIVEELFSSAELLKYNDEIINKAKIRFDLGMPPGKKVSYGDSVIWETLLKEFPENEELHFVSFDKDFKSNIDDNDFSPFLLEEWKEKKKSNIVPYKELGHFIKSKLPEIEESEKIIEEEKKVDKNYLVTTTAWNEAVKEIAKTANFWGPIAEGLKANRNIIENTLSAVRTIPQDTFGQQAAILSQCSKTFDIVKNIKIPFLALKSYTSASELGIEKPDEKSVEKTTEPKKEEPKTEEKKEDVKGKE